ncbi:putative reverse transcriptase domain-containing protein [Tanacetum coccineum]
MSKLKEDGGNGIHAQGWVYAVGNAEKRGNAPGNPDANSRHGSIAVELGSFDVIIGMDWLRRYHAVIICDEKLVQVPYGNETLTFCGNESSNGRESRLTVILMVQKLEITWQGLPDRGRTIVEIFRVCFPRTLPGLPPNSTVEFQIGLVPGAAPVVARAQHIDWPHRNEGKLSEQLQELSDKGFIRPSSSPWGARSSLSKRREEEMVSQSFQNVNFGIPKGQISSERQLIVEAYMWTGQDRVYQIFEAAKSMTKLTQKGIKFDWGEKEEDAFQLIKQKLCSAPILALPEGSEDFVVYCDASHKGLGAVLMQREKVFCYVLDTAVFRPTIKPTTHSRSEELNMKATRWLELLSDTDCDIRYHPWNEKCSGSKPKNQRNIVSEDGRRFDPIGYYQGKIGNHVADGTLCLSAGVENNGKDRPDHAKDAAARIDKRATRSEAKADGVRGWGHGCAQGLTLERVVRFGKRGKLNPRYVDLSKYSKSWKGCLQGWKLPQELFVERAVENIGMGDQPIEAEPDTTG